jgi:hydrogenase nickel incorporation protein HypA/HybF
MHELPITQSILEITLRHAQQAHANRVASINLVIGQLASVVDDSVQFYWDMISEGTIAQGALLNFERKAVVLKCLNCENEYTPAGESFACPNCQSESIKIISGEEFYLESIEVE